MPEPTPVQPSYIATRGLIGVDTLRGSFEIRVCIGLPHQTESGDWRCPLFLQGLHSPLKGPVGVDAFQSLMLAHNLARTLLTAFVERGGKLLDGPDGREVSVQGLFDSGLMS
jgi:hypothetical protein